MTALRKALLGTPTRRALAIGVSNAAFFGGGFFIHRYIDDQATSPGLTFGLVAFWMALGLTAALLTVVGLGDRLFHRGYLASVLRDEMAELDARLDAAGRGETVPIAVDDDADEMPEIAATKGDATFKFALYFIFWAVASLLISNQISGGFMQRYSHPGVAVVHMRSPDAAVRRRGLEMLADRLDFRVTPAVVAVVGQALTDPDEGVVAKAATVAGSLGLDALAPQLADLVRTRPALAFTALIALAHLGHAGPEKAPEARKAATALATAPEAQAEPRALAMMLGMLRVPAIQQLQGLYAQGASDPELRFAATWALGQLNDPQLLAYMAQALADADISVRCVAAVALEKMVIFEAGAPLRAAFEASTDPMAHCPEVHLPVQQETGRPILLPYRNYELTLVRALATTDDPVLLTWLVKHQEGREYRTHMLMQRVWERLGEKDKRGELQALKQRVRLQRLSADAGEPPPEGAADAGPDAAPAAPDAGPAAADAALTP